MADITPSGNPLDDNLTAWIAYEVNKINRIDDPAVIPAPVPSNSRTKYTAKTANTDKNFQARMVAWLHGAELGGETATPIRLRDGISIADTAIVRAGTGSPEGVVTAAIGSVWLRTDGAAGTTVYVKESGAGNTGWSAIAASDHGSLGGLGDDDHAQYSLVAGTRAFTGTVAGVTPTTATHLATKAYVDNIVQGVEWQDSVLDRDLVSPPGGESTGDRYLVDAVATGDWTGHEDEIAEYNGTGWDFTSPTLGMITTVDDEVVTIRWNGSAWTAFELTLDHGALTGLSDITDHTWAALVDGTRNITGAQIFENEIHVDTVGDALVRVDKGTASDSGTIAFQRAGSTWWHLEHAATSDAFTVGRYAGGAGLTDTPLSIDNAAGNAVFLAKLAAHGAAIANGVSGADSMVVGAGTGAAGFTAFTSNAGIGSIQFTDTTATRKGAIEYQQSVFEMSFYANGAKELGLTPVALFPYADMGLYLGATNRFWLATYTDRLLVDQAEAADAVTGAAQVIVGDGTVAAGMTIFTSATTAGQVAMTDAAGTNVGAWRYDHNSVRHEWDVEGAEEMTLTASALAPSATGGLALGSLSARWGDALLDRGFFGGSTGSSPVAGADEGVFGEGTGDRGITLFAGAAAVAAVHFIDTATVANGWVKYDHLNVRFDLGVEGTSEVYLTAAALSPAADKGLNLGSATLQFDDVFAVSLRLEEQASAPATAAAGEGIFWVDDAVATVPMFTDDADISHRLAYSDAWQIVIRASDMYGDANNEPATATTDNQHKVMAYIDNGGVSGPQGAIYEGIWPRGYRGNGVTIRVHYSSNTANAGGYGINWLAAFENMTSQDIDSDGWSTEVEYDHVPGPSATAGLITIASFTMTDGAQIDSLAVGNAFRFRLRRDGADAEDDFTNTVNVHRVEITENV